jgi:hypothetical protein
MLTFDNSAITGFDLFTVAEIFLLRPLNSSNDTF